MWNCIVCRAEIEDDSWETCWRCSSPRDVDAQTAHDLRNKVMEKMCLAQSMQCLRCHHKMEYAGLKRFHEGAKWGFWFGDFGELFVNRERYVVYVCPQCGKMEFFLDGIGNKERGETEPPQLPEEKRLDHNW